MKVVPSSAARPEATPARGRMIRRFGRGTLLVHAGLIVSVYGLILTGMPLKYPRAFWAVPLTAMWGGPENAGRFHRGFASLLIAVCLLHLAGVALALLTRRLPRLLGPDSMIPLPADVRGLRDNVRFLLGRGPRPAFGRFTYWEKFDYLAVFWGMAIIGGSGLIMWFPEVAARFLPGWGVNVALIIHSDEALLATGFLFAVHFFNTHLRPDVFPLDTSIFSGVVPEDEVRRRWPGWYERLRASGELGAREAVPPRQPRWIRAAGLLAVGLGVAILLLVMTAALGEVLRQLVSFLR